MKLYDFQKKGLEETKTKNRVAYYWDMGTGKTFVGAEKAICLGKPILLVCQKSKIADWIDHFKEHYPEYAVASIVKEKTLKAYMNHDYYVGVINYDLVWRKSELIRLRDFTLVLDESSLIQNERSKRAKFILYSLKPNNVVLLSGTPCNGKYENLWSQIHLLGWDISRQAYWNTYIDYKIDKSQGFPLVIVKGYKKVERLKSKLKEYGCSFLKTDEVIELPEQVESAVKVPICSSYAKFRKDRIVTVGDKELVGDTTLTKLLYERMLCGQYNDDKIEALKDLLESTEDRIIVFYNFNEELKIIFKMSQDLNRPLSMVNGNSKDLNAYENYENSITAIQYQSGAMGLNLQKSNKIVYFTPPLSSELFEQSKKRTNRIGQNRTCFYYKLVCRGSIEERIYRTLAMRRDYTNALFEKDEKDGC